jgi:uncharacterized protein DUF3108
MTHSRFAIPIFAAGFLFAGTASSQTGFPFSNETLRYSINWPSGLSLGDATMTANRTGNQWGFEATLDAGVPGFTIRDKYRSTVEGDLCSTTLERDISHGGKKVREQTTFDQKKGTARRATVLPENGGESSFDIPACARDALAFVYFVRREMGQGRVAPPQKVFFGSAYSVRIEYTGAMTINIGNKPAVTDHVVVSCKGPKSDFSFEVFFARDAARTPLSIRIPVSVGTLSLELVR